MSFLTERLYRTKNRKGIMIVNRRAAIIVVGVVWRSGTSINAGRDLYYCSRYSIDDD